MYNLQQVMLKQKRLKEIRKARRQEIILTSDYKLFDITNNRNLFFGNKIQCEKQLKVFNNHTNWKIIIVKNDFKK